MSAILFPCYDPSSRLSLTSHLSLQDEKKLNLASAIGGNEAVLMPEEYLNTNRNSRYGSSLGVNEAFSTLGSRKYNSNFFSQSCDPLKMLEDDIVDNYGETFYSNTVGRQPNKTRPPNVALPMDAEDYLVPSPQSPTPATPSSVNNNKNTYRDLISETGKQGGARFIYPPSGYFLPGETFHTVEQHSNCCWSCN